PFPISGLFASFALSFDLSAAIRLRSRFMMHLKGIAILLFMMVVLTAIAAQQAVPPQQTAPPPLAHNHHTPPPGVELMAPGQVHEACAWPATDRVRTQPVSKNPPAALEVTPPAEKAEGEVVWIGGYWACDDDRKDLLWGSGTWRSPPPGKLWVSGF